MSDSEPYPDGQRNHSSIVLTQGLPRVACHNGQCGGPGGEGGEMRRVRSSSFFSSVRRVPRDGLPLTRDMATSFISPVVERGCDIASHLSPGQSFREALEYRCLPNRVCRLGMLIGGSDSAAKASGRIEPLQPRVMLKEPASSRLLRNSLIARSRDGSFANQRGMLLIRRKRIRTCAGLAELRKCRKALSQQPTSHCQALREFSWRIANRTIKKGAYVW